jgi:hypothetical protein
MIMDMIFDIATGSLAIDTASVTPWGADLRAVIQRHGHVINLRGVNMRLTVTAGGAEVFDMHLPAAGVRYKQTDQDILATGRVEWLPDQAVFVQAWCKTNTGDEATATASFTSPRPDQPYPSWAWTNGAWVPPVAYPDDGQFHEWDEAGLAWVEADP